MADTVDLPKIGPVKKVYVYGVGGTAVAYVLWRYWRAGAAGSSAPEELPAETDTSSVTQGGGGAYGPGNTQYAGSDTQDDADMIVTNADWSQVALDRVTAVGFDATAAGSALGKFLQRQKLTPLEVTIVQTAVAFTGMPPVGGPYAITPATTGTTPTTPNNPHGSAPAKPGLLAVDTIHSDNVILKWAGSANATKYEIGVSGKGSKTLGAQSNYRFEGLKPNTSYTAHVRAGNATGWSAWTPVIRFRTLKKG